MKVRCLECNEPIEGREGKKFCNTYCKSSYHYKLGKRKISLFKQIDKQLKLNRKLLKTYNKAGKATIRKEYILEQGFNPQYFTHYWKAKNGNVYLFCYEYGFMEKSENGNSKFVLIQWQNYMSKL